jgi:hypothetical protein
MNRKSKWANELNTIAIKRMSAVVDKELNISNKCHESFYGHETNTQPGREPLTVIAMAGLSAYACNALTKRRKWGSKQGSHVAKKFPGGT